MWRAIAAGLSIFWVAGAARAEPIALRYGQTASTLRSVFSLPIFVAEREGFFAAEGLAVTVVPIQGGTDRMIAALNDDKVDITHVSTPFLIQAALAGSDAVAISGEFANPIYHLVARPGISTFADLKGRVIGMAAAGDMVAIATRKLLAMNGTENGSYRIKELVGTPARVKWRL
jgi:ABC-type nitrate/sulfonate/bicarbonate transport system substrate-binding protein